MTAVNQLNLRMTRRAFLSHSTANIGMFALASLLRPDLLQALAMVCVKLERESRAIGFLERALQVAPNDPAVRRALAALKPKPQEEPKPTRVIDLIDLIRRDRPA